MRRLIGIKKFIIFLFVTFLFFGVTNVVFAESNDEAIIRKHQETKNKIYQLKLLENKESNKLYKNQQKLENTTKDLEYSKKRYNVTKTRLVDIEAELASAVADYNKTLVKVRHRIRNIYMHHRKNLFELLLTSDDINSFMDELAKIIKKA